MKNKKQIGILEHTDDIWKKTDKKINILNPADFEIPSFVTDIEKRFDLGIRDTLGISDPIEVKERLEIMRVLMDDRIYQKL